MVGWEEHIPGDWMSRGGRLWRDMSWAERQDELWSNPSLRRLLPTSFRQQRAKELRASRREKSQGVVWAGLDSPGRPATLSMSESDET